MCRWQLRASQHADLILRKLPIAGADPAAALEQVMRSAGESRPVAAETPAALFKAEQTYPGRRRSSFRFSICRWRMRSEPRVRDLHLRADGTPDLADASLEDAR